MSATNLVMRFIPAGKEVNANIEFAIANLSRGFFRKADHFFARAAAIKDNLQIEASCLHAYFLDHQQRQSGGEKKRRKKTENQWTRAIDLILADDEAKGRFRRLGESLNEVLEVGGQGLLHDTFIFKKSKRPEYLEKEWKITGFAHELFGYSDTIVQPFVFLKKNGEAVFVIRRVAGKPLAQMR